MMGTVWRRAALALILALGVGVASEASAQVIAPKQQRKKIYNAATSSRKLLNQVALNASAGSRTVTANVSDYASLTWQVDFTWSAASTITMTCSGSLNGGVTFGNVNGVALAAGVATLSTVTWTKAVTASTNELITIDTQAYDSVACIFGGAGATGSDLVTIYAIAVSGA